MVNGELSTNFVENLCDDNMTYCFESYNSNLTEVTASCQSMGSDQKLLDVCKVTCQLIKFLCANGNCVNHRLFFHFLSFQMNGKCRERSDIDVTVCCCTSDLCNLQDDLKPTPEVPVDLPEDGNSTFPSIDRFVELNETMGLELELNETMGL